MAFKKKLYRYRPNREGLEIETQRTTTTRRPQLADARSLERGVRQLLADKVSGSMVGLWLLAPEHLRLGTFDLLCGWTGQPPSEVEPRLALQVVHEAALCVSGVRATGGWDKTNPLYAHGFFTRTVGLILLAVGGICMALGIFIMTRMVKIDV